WCREGRTYPASGMARDRIVTTSVAAPWGPIHVAASRRGGGGLHPPTSHDEVSARLEAPFWRPPPGLHSAATRERASAMLARAVRALDRFTAGDLHALDDLPVDLEDRPAWDRLVLDAVRSIPPGATASYGQIARMIGKPGAARAVGGAVGRCPVGLVIPCHRVIAGDGTLGGYGGGWGGGRQAAVDCKRGRSAREGARPRANP